MPLLPPLDIIIVAHKSLHSKIGQFLKLHINESGHRITIFTSDEYESGTVGALKAVRPLLDRDFILLSCDLITDFPLYRMIDQHRMGDALVTALLTRDTGSKQEEARYGDADDCQVFAAVDETKKRLLYLKGKADVDCNINFQLSLLAKFSCVLLKTNLVDAHCYIFRKAFLNMLDLGTCFGKRTLYSIREEMLPRLVKHQTHPSHTKNAPPKAGYTCAVRLVEDDFCLRANNLRNYNEANKFVPQCFLKLSPNIIGVKRIAIGTGEDLEQCRSGAQIADRQRFPVG